MILTLFTVFIENNKSLVYKELKRKTFKAKQTTARGQWVSPK